jgi:hypothetical protein
MEHVRGFESWRVRLAVMVLLTLAPAVPASAQVADAATRKTVAIPDSPVGRLFTQFLGAFNSMEQAPLDAFFTRSWSGNALTERVLARAKQTGGYDVRGFTESDDVHLLAIVQERGGANAFARISFNVAASSPERMTRLLFGPAQASDVPAPPLTATDIEAAKTGAAYRQFSAWLETFNAGDRDRIEKYLTASWPTAALDGQAALRDRTGGFEQVALEQATPTMLVGTMKERNTEQRYRFTLTIEQSEPNRIVRLGMVQIQKP